MRLRSTVCAYLNNKGVQDQLELLISSRARHLAPSLFYDLIRKVRLKGNGSGRALSLLQRAACTTHELGQSLTASLEVDEQLLDQHQRPAFQHFEGKCTSGQPKMVGVLIIRASTVEHLVDLREWNERKILLRKTLCSEQSLRN